MWYIRVKRFTFFRGDRFTEYNFTWFGITWGRLIRHNLSEFGISIGYIVNPSLLVGEAPVEDFPIPPQETTAGKRKPRWLRETLKEAQEVVGRPMWSVRESKPLERLGGFMANVVETKPTSFEEATSQ